MASLRAAVAFFELEELPELKLKSGKRRGARVSALAPEERWQRKSESSEPPQMPK